MTTPESDSAEPTPEQLKELSALRNHTEALIEAMEMLLQRGKETNERAAEVYKSGTLQPGDGERLLMGNSMPPGDRHVYTVLLTEYENLQENVRNFQKRETKAAPVDAKVRAVGNRYRI